MVDFFLGATRPPAATVPKASRPPFYPNVCSSFGEDALPSSSLMPAASGRGKASIVRSADTLSRVALSVQDQTEAGCDLCCGGDRRAAREQPGSDDKPKASSIPDSTSSPKAMTAICSARGRSRICEMARVSISTRQISRPATCSSIEDTADDGRYGDRLGSQILLDVG